ncbi:hypothetical protein C0993_009549 [Termitomyces sp. T159_Od127]|nr:hypothetical protein C0993_009549 [Termitomyces sp. T159_Od127]
MYNPPSASYVPPEGYPLKPSGPPQDAQAPSPQDVSPTNVREPSGQRRGGRRPSFTGRRPPCLFFPAGRCKNGAECRFPHVPPDGNAPHHMPYFSARGPKPPRQPNGNGVNNITDKMAGLAVRDDAPGHRNGLDGSSRPQSTDTNRPRYHQGKNGYGQNGARAEKRPPPPPKQQRVPNADEFPVLAGANTPPTRNGLSNGHLGPTAAQVLSAPAPARKDATPKDSSTRGTSPDLKSAAASKASLTLLCISARAESVGEPVPAATTHDHPAPAKLPISFAAVAAPELPKEIALSA